ncbi:MAG: helix-turn-helix transcriptional regulator [Lachnospiraceae bacterium]|nr:helix-turn-helix transcriptional regulator [Lachnospiraceae bacterium]
MNQEKIGKFISLSRKNKRLTQEQLAEKLGVSINAVSKWERGLNLPDVSLMEKLCEVLDFTLNELFAGEKLTNEEMVRKSEKNIMSLMMTLKQLRIVEVFTQILIGVGIALTISSFFILTKINQKVVFTIIGLFIWIFGLFFKVKIRKTINQLEN